LSTIIVVRRMRLRVSALIADPPIFHRSQGRLVGSLATVVISAGVGMHAPAVLQRVPCFHGFAEHPFGYRLPRKWRTSLLLASCASVL